MNLKNIVSYQKISSIINFRFFSHNKKENAVLYDNCDKIDFFNTKIAFATKKTSEIIRALVVFKLCSIDKLVNNNTKVLKWTRMMLGERLFEFLMRKTIYGHFVAGVSHVDIHKLVKLNRKFGVKSILDYSVEKDICEEKSNDTKAYDKNMETFKNSIDASASTANEGEGVIALKITALSSPELLVHISDILVQLENLLKPLVGQMDANIVMSKSENLQKNLKNLDIRLINDKQLIQLVDVHKTSVVDLFVWLHRENIQLKRMDDKTVADKLHIEPLSNDLMLQMVKEMIQRLDYLAKYAKEKKVQLMIDAEQSYMQPAIRRITMDLMRIHNKEQCVIFNTYQCYLKESFAYLKHDLNLSQQEGFYFGAKLVRGAYMDQERERARLHNYESPINDTFELTTSMYYKCLEMAFRSIHSRPTDEVQMMIASHNMDTIRHAIKKLHEYEINPKEKSICFGQLLGMCDQISYTLGHLGYSVYKYMPYGPVNDVLPYLSRRALENRAVIAKCDDEQNLLWKELFRRFRLSNIF